MIIRLKYKRYDFVLLCLGNEDRPDFKKVVVIFNSVQKFAGDLSQKAQLNSFLLDKLCFQQCNIYMNSKYFPGDRQPADICDVVVVGVILNVNKMLNLPLSTVIMITTFQHTQTLYKIV
jgi:hypothetical protein